MNKKESKALNKLAKEHNMCRMYNNVMQQLKFYTFSKEEIAE